MAVGSNFERLEQEVDRLLQVLDQFKQENEHLKGRLTHMESENDQLKVRNEELSQIEQSHQENMRNQEGVKSRIDSILARLDEVQF